MSVGGMWGWGEGLGDSCLMLLKCLSPHPLHIYIKSDAQINALTCVGFSPHGRSFFKTYTPGFCVGFAWSNKRLGTSLGLSGGLGRWRVASLDDTACLLLGRWRVASLDDTACLLLGRWRVASLADTACLLLGRWRVASLADTACLLLGRWRVASLADTTCLLLGRWRIADTACY